MKQADKWADLPTRIISALVILPVSLGCIWAGGHVFLVFLAVLSLICAYEWCHISGLSRSLPSVMLLWAGIVISFYLFNESMDIMNYGILAALFIVLFGLNFKMNKSDALIAALGMPYLFLGFFSCYLLRDSYQGMIHLGWIVAMVVATDIGAYMSGRTFGGPKIAPRISPKKTWAGLIGGIVASVLVTLYFQEQSYAFSNQIHSYAIAALIPIVAQTGDFLESWLKRRAGVKDASNLIPGHGGFLDRLDGFLVALPVFAFFKFLI